MSLSKNRCVKIDDNLRQGALSYLGAKSWDIISVWVCSSINNSIELLEGSKLQPSYTMDDAYSFTIANTQEDKLAFIEVLGLILSRANTGNTLLAAL